jgi:hypothetical protein
VQLTPLFRHLISLRSKYSSQNKPDICLLQNQLNYFNISITRSFIVYHFTSLIIRNSAERTYWCFLWFSVLSVTIPVNKINRLIFKHRCDTFSLGINLILSSVYMIVANQSLE